MSTASTAPERESCLNLCQAGDGVGSVNGPLGAVEQFVRDDPRFQIDTGREAFVLTFNPAAT